MEEGSVGHETFFALLVDWVLASKRNDGDEMTTPHDDVCSTTHTSLHHGIDRLKGSSSIGCCKTNARVFRHHIVGVTIQMIERKDYGTLYLFVHFIIPRGDVSTSTHDECDGWLFMALLLLLWLLLWLLP